MLDKLKTVVVIPEERLRKEYRHILGKVEFARIEQEVLFSESILDEQSLEEIAGINPQVLVVDLPSESASGLNLLTQLGTQFPVAALLVVGNSPDPTFLIEAMRRGVKEFFSRPLSADKFGEAYRRLAKVIFADVSEKPPGKIFSFFSSKGGNGSTTIATNFAVSLSRISKKKVLVVDLDTQLGDAAEFFGVKEKRYLIQEGSETWSCDSKHISKTIVNHPKAGIDILLLTSGYSRHTKPFPTELKHLLNHLQREYDYLILDTSNILDSNTIVALDASDLIFLISKCSLPALRNAQKVLHVFDRLAYPRSKIRMLINRYSKLDEIDLKLVEKTLSFQIYWVLPNDFKSMISSIQAGVPLTMKSQTLPLAKSIYEMSAHVFGAQKDSKPKPPDKGFLERAKETMPKSPAFTTLNLLKS